MTEPEPLELAEREGVTVVSFIEPNALDAYHVAETGRHLFALVEKQGRRRLVLDVSNIRMISSQCLGTLLGLRQKLAAVGGGLAIAGMDPMLSRVFKITRLHQAFPFCGDVDSAVEAVVRVDSDSEQ